MKKALLILTALLCATPAFADDDAAAREKDRRFFNFSKPPGSQNDETRITDKGCVEYKMPDWFIEKYGNNRGNRILWAIMNNIISKEILTTNKCTCAMLYPKWDKAIAIYEIDFAKLNAWAPYGTPTNKYLSEFHNQSEANIAEAREICKKAGAW